ncbi:MAG: YnbE family lipoprotein [Hyphomonadaceae bacterium]|nr:YnbE family lipoprotein [Hyphomonadaceae bacterium]MBC6411489.1 YnbE family lipoprotein [Hyphomonadaceae bacterium]
MQKLMLSSCIGLLALAACQPKVQILAPDKPTEIILNVKIDQEVRVRLDKEVEDLISGNPDLF